MTTSATSQSATAFLSRFRPPASLLTARARPNGWMKTSSLALLTSIPRYTCVLTLCCDGALPCMRDSLPIICSGQASKGGRILLTHGSKPEGLRSRPPDRLGGHPQAVIPSLKSIRDERDHARGRPRGRIFDGRQFHCRLPFGSAQFPRFAV